MKSYRYWTFAASLLVATLALFACGGGTSSSADTGVTITQVNTAITTAVNAAVGQIQSQIGQLKLVGFAKGESATTDLIKHQARAQAIALGITQDENTNPCTNLGTVLSFNPFATSVVIFQTCTNYIQARDRITGALTHPMDVFYDQPGCAAGGGNVYLNTNPAPGQGLDSGTEATGFAFGDGTNAWMITAAEGTTPATAVSELDTTGACNAVSVTDNWYAAQANAAATTGADSAAVATPFAFGAPSATTSGNAASAN